MTASSLSTFLDVTAPSAPGAANEISTRAKVLVAVGEQWELATVIAERAGLQLGEALAALGWLEQHKLVEMRRDHGGIQVQLTESTRQALRNH
jgi:hypothetical protein